MILYCEILMGSEITDCEPKQAQYQILYSNFGTGKEQFSMNYLNKLTGKYQNVKENSRIWKKGLKHAQYHWNQRITDIKTIKNSLKLMKLHV